MKREIIRTGDGTSTIYLPEWEENYHSKHGATQEALHVFIEKGLTHYLSKSSVNKVSILEIGFGTGLNALLSILQARVQELDMHYSAVEAYPVQQEELDSLNYAEVLDQENIAQLFKKLHDSPWEQEIDLAPYFRLHKRKQFFSEISDVDRFDLIYFDAFGPRVQPELWTEIIFEKMYKALRDNGSLVTYSAKGAVRRAMQTVGFEVERLEGPPGKREMLRANKRI